MEQYRQGDILIRRATALPAGAVPASGSVLARGEATGHAHAVVGDGVVFWDPASEALYVQVMKSAEVTHPEHKPITLGPGIYEIIRQREYTPESNHTVHD